MGDRVERERGEKAGRKCENGNNNRGKGGEKVNSRALYGIY